MSHSHLRFLLSAAAVTVGLIFAMAVLSREVSAAAPGIHTGPHSVAAAAAPQTSAPLNTPCPVGYNIAQSSGALIDPGVTLVTGSQCDDCTKNVTLPFTYTLYNRNFTSLSVSSNGLISFIGSDRTFVNMCLPYTLVNYGIYPLWNDWTTDNDNAACDGYPNQNCGIYTSVSGSAPNRVFNIEWRAVSFDRPVLVNFEVRLLEGQPSFQIVYGSLDLTPGHTDVSTVGAQMDTGSIVDTYQCPDIPGTLAPGTRLTFQLNDPCAAQSPTPTSTPSFTPTFTPTQIPTSTNTPGPAGLLNGHLTWQGITQPNAHNTGITATLSICVGGVAQTYPVATDASGNFSVASGLSDGQYNWWLKGQTNLANVGALTISGGSSNFEAGTMRGGDANNSNVVTTIDFNILKNSFGKSNGLPGYDSRADFNRDQVITTLDFNMLKGNFGASGSTATCP